MCSSSKTVQMKQRSESSVRRCGNARHAGTRRGTRACRAEAPSRREAFTEGMPYHRMSDQHTHVRMLTHMVAQASVRGNAHIAHVNGWGIRGKCRDEDYRHTVDMQIYTHSCMCRKQCWSLQATSAQSSRARTHGTRDGAVNSQKRRDDPETSPVPIVKRTR